MTGHVSRPLFFTAIATLRCIQTTAIKFLSSLRERRARKRRCIAGGYLLDMPIPARSIPTRVGAESWSTGTSTELDTHGREAALRAPTPIHADRTQRGKCCVSSSSIRSHSSQVRRYRHWTRPLQYWWREQGRLASSVARCSCIGRWSIEIGESPSLGL